MAMPCPFGGFGNDNIEPIAQVSGSDVNYIDGFPSAYGAPSSNNGKFVRRKQMNAIGRLASNDLFYHKCGGLNTFDADFCAAVGGYPKGAVLKMLGDHNTVFDVISLVDNNTFDFTENGIDNEHWKYLNLNIGDPSLDDTVFQWTGANSEGVIQVGTFIAPKTGTLRVSTTPNINKIGSEVIIPDPFPSTVGSNKFFNGIGIIVAPSSIMVTPDTLIFSNEIFSIGVMSLSFGVMTATLSSTPFRSSISIQNKRFTQYSLSKDIAYTVYIINSPECTTTGSFSSTPTVYGNTYSLDGTLTILM